MKKLLLGLLVGLLVMFIWAQVIWAQEVEITGFPQAKGIGAGKEFFKPYYPKLEEIAGLLKTDASTRLLVIGQSDGLFFKNKKYNDGLNAGVEISRIDAVVSFLKNEFQVNTSQITIQTRHVTEKGAEHRKVILKIVRSPGTEKLTRLPEGVYIPEFQEKRLIGAPPSRRPSSNESIGLDNEFIGLDLGLGMTSAPLGVLPTLTASIDWQKKIYIEAKIGASVFEEEKSITGGHEITTRDRLVAAYLVFFPTKDFPLGFIGGWQMNDEVLTNSNRYVRRLEGPIIGIRADIKRRISLDGLWNPGYFEDVLSKEDGWRNDQASISLSFKIL